MHLLTAFLLFSPLTHAAEPPTAPPRAAVIDRRGKAIQLPGPPKRIVALGPSVSETVVALGATDRLVGRSRFCNGVPELQNVPEMGGISDPSLEKLLEGRPDLVIGLEFLPESTAKTLEDSGIPVACFDFSTWEEVTESILSIGRLLGGEAEEKSQGLYSQLTGSLAEYGNAVATDQGGKKVKTLVMFDAEKLFSAGGNSYLGTILRTLGADNIADRASSAWPELSRESVLEFDPECVIVLVGPEEVAGAAKKVAKWRDDPYWSQLTAVKTGHVAVQRNFTLIVPGPRLTAGIVVLMNLLHPGLDPESIAAMEKGGELVRPLQ